MRLPIALLALAVLAPAGASAAVAPPPPPGRAPVGLLRITLTDHHRAERLAPGGGPRRIPLRVWYSAARPGSSPRQVLDAAEQAAYESVFTLPSGALHGIGATTTAGAPPARGRHAVILLSPGWGNSSAFHDAQASDLASHGYVVVGIAPPGDTTVVDAGGGRLLTMTPAGERIQDRSAVQRLADVRYVFHHLGAVRGAGRLDRRRLRAYGHSVGAPPGG